MNRFFFVMLACLMVHAAIAQQASSVPAQRVTFKLKIKDLPSVDSASLIWFTMPYQQGSEQQSFFPSTNKDGNLYQQTITFPDSLKGRIIGYLYATQPGQYDFIRSFALDNNADSERIETWGYADAEGKIRTTQMLFNLPGSPEETAEFSNPYVGITTNGTAVKNLFPIKKTGYSTLPVKNAVAAFLASLTTEEKEKSNFPVESIEWRRWHNIEDWERAGICLEQLKPVQKELVFAFLKESLSARGLQKAKDIMTMEAYLATLVPESKSLGGEKYWFTFYGTPSDKEPWGWQIEGHHMVINYFVLGDQIVMTPAFMGSEPTYIDSGAHKGLRTFRAEEEKGLKFYLSLDSIQKKTATVYAQKEYDLNQAEAFRDNRVIPLTGIPARLLTTQQRAALLELIAEYVNNIRDGQAKVKMEEVKLHLDETHFTWIQNKSPESPFYYRIHSPVILIEFDHQTPVFIYDRSKLRRPQKSHIHTVVRTPNGNDYGKDLLKEHLEKDHKGQEHHHHSKPAKSTPKKQTLKK